MRRASAKREPFLVFPKRKSLPTSDRTSVQGALFLVFGFPEMDSTFFSATFVHRAQSTRHTSPMPVPAGSVHAHAITKPSRVGARL